MARSLLFCYVLLIIINKIYGSILSASEIDDLRNALMNKIDTFSNDFTPKEDKPLAASIVRLVFHDCAGPFNSGTSEDTLNNSLRLCDGCIDMDIEDHAGLESFAVEPLEEIYQDFKTKVNRADFW
eukprot:229277_1